MKAIGFAISKALRRFIWLVVGLPVLYILIYLLLSLCGQYRPMSASGVSRWEVFATWAPLGFYDSHPPAGPLEAKLGGAWRDSMIRVYYRLWTADNHYVHKRHDVYMAGFLGDDGQWTYTTNHALPIDNGK